MKVVFSRSALRTRMPSGASASTETSNRFLFSFARPTGLMALRVFIVYIGVISFWNGLALSVFASQIHLSQRERQKPDGQVQALPLRKDFPRAGGRCRASDRKGSLSPKVTERARTV